MKPWLFLSYLLHIWNTFSSRPQPPHHTGTIGIKKIGTTIPKTRLISAYGETLSSIQLVNYHNYSSSTFIVNFPISHLVGGFSVAMLLEDVSDIKLPYYSQHMPCMPVIIKPPLNHHEIWVNYNELTTSSLEIIVSKGNHPLLWP